MKQTENEKRMSDQHMIEEHLAETLLDRVTGGVGRVQDCPECLGHLQQYRSAKIIHDAMERRADEYIRVGHGQIAYGVKEAADRSYKLAQEMYHKIRIHEHVDFPEALGH